MKNYCSFEGENSLGPWCSHRLSQMKEEIELILPCIIDFPN